MLKVETIDISSPRLPVSYLVLIESTSYDNLNDFMQSAVEADMHYGDVFALRPSKLSNYTLDFDWLISQVELQFVARCSHYRAVSNVNVFDGVGGDDTFCSFRWVYRKKNSYFYHAWYRSP